METFFSYYLISLGLGQFASIAFSKEDHYRAFGLNTFLGFSLIPILLFVLNLIFKVPLNISAYIVILISIPGLVLFFLKIKKHGLAVLNHPLFLLVIPILVVFGVASQGYYPFSWDEFSHWATMPKQIFLHKQITSDDFLIKNFAAYTPGWPLIMIFKDLIFSKSLQYDHFLFLPLFSGLLMISSFYDALLLSFKNSETLSWTIILLAALIGIPMPYFYETNLIEFPMIHGLCVVFTLCFLQINSKIKVEDNFFRIGLALAYCYLLKHTFMTMLPIIFLFYLFFIFKGNNWFTKKNFILLLYLFVPYLVVFFIWQWNLEAHSLVQGYSPVNNTLAVALNKASNRLEILPLSIKSFLFLIVSGKMPQIALMLLLPFAIAFTKKIRQTIVLITAYIFFYYACLMWMYFTVFSLEEAKALASFDRFMSIPLAPLTLFSFLGFALWFWEKISGKLKLVLLQHKIKFFCLGLIMISGVFYRKIHRTPITKNEISKQSLALKKFIDQNKLKQPKVLIIAQGGDRFEYHIANFESIGSDSYKFSVLFGTSWGEKIDNSWRISSSKQEMLNLISQSNILWIVKSDQWMDTNLKVLNFTNKCDSAFENYFILNNGNGTYLCSKKD